MRIKIKSASNESWRVSRRNRERDSIINFRLILSARVPVLSGLLFALPFRVQPVPQKFSDRSDGEAHVVDADVGWHVHVRFGLQHQPGAGAAVPDHEGLRHRGHDPVVQLADHRVSVRVHVLRGSGHVLQVPGLRPDQVGLFVWGGGKTAFLIMNVSVCVCAYVCVQSGPDNQRRPADAAVRAGHHGKHARTNRSFLGRRVLVRALLGVRRAQLAGRRHAGGLHHSKINYNFRSVVLFIL